MKLQGAVTVVTGASRGLGAALARELARREARVALLARDGEALGTLVTELQQAGIEARAYPLDLNDVGSCGALLEKIDAEMGPPDVLVCNAATAVGGEVVDLAWTDFEESMRVNFLGHAALTGAVLPKMIQRGRGTIAFVLSGVVWRPVPAFAPYSVSKAALSAFADSLRVELRGAGPRVLTVFPGLLDTEFLSRTRVVGDSPPVRSVPLAAKPERVARIVVRALERDRSRVLLWGPARIVYHLDHFVPGLIDRLLRRSHQRSKAKETI